MGWRWGGGQARGVGGSSSRPGAGARGAEPGARGREAALNEPAGRRGKVVYEVRRDPPSLS